MLMVKSWNKRARRSLACNESKYSPRKMSLILAPPHTSPLSRVFSVTYATQTWHLSLPEMLKAVM